MKITLFCFGIAPISSVSGMEKVYVEMANEFADRGHEVTCVWNDLPGVKPFYKLDNKVRTINLGLGKIKAPLQYKVWREINKAFKRNALNKVDVYKTELLCDAIEKSRLERQDVYICYEFNSVMVANRLSGGKIPVIAMVHNSIEDQIEALTPLQRKEASKATAYQVLMPSYVEKAKKLLDTEVIYIPNVVPMVDENNAANLALNKEKYKIIHVGRVEGRQKRQFILIKSFSEIADKFPNWEVDYYGPVGDAAYKEKIDQFVKEHKLEKRVNYRGVTNNVPKSLKSGDIFAFPSAYEGFPLALTEAMGCGLPAIGFEYAPSVGELIKDGHNGSLAKNDEEFVDKLAMLMESKDLRIKMGKAARVDMQQYAPKVVWDTWEGLLKKYRRTDLF